MFFVYGKRGSSIFEQAFKTWDEADAKYRQLQKWGFSATLHAHALS